MNSNSLFKPIVKGKSVRTQTGQQTLLNEFKTNLINQCPCTCHDSKVKSFCCSCICDVDNFPTINQTLKIKRWKSIK